jgi:ribosomal protein S27E
MVALPAKPQPTLEAIYASYVKDEKPRPYLGASIIGKECARALWYDFRWCSEKKFDGRMMRLFATGHREEDRLVEDLRRIGVKVWANNPGTGKQWSFAEASVGGHFAGNCDGVLQGLEEAPKAAHVLECKTHSAKSFADLKAKGVRESKPQHFAQMQIYMHWTIADFGKDEGCHRALYLAHNKDTDELYMERIEYDKKFADALVQKAAGIIFASQPTARISDNPSWFACKWCDHHAICHGEALPVVSCRTCCHATPEKNGGWSCAVLKDQISEDVQRRGCQAHLYVPPLLENVARPVDGNNDSVTYERKDGKQFINGAGGYESNEIRHGLKVLGDPLVEDMRDAFGARIAG